MTAGTMPAKLGRYAPSGLRLIYRKLIKSLHADLSGKKSSQSFLRNDFVSRRRTSHADQTRDLRWFGSCAGCNDGACAGEEFHRPEDRRQIDFIVLPCLPAGGRRIVDTVAMPGAGARFQRTAAAQIRNEQRRRRNSLSK